MTSVGCRSVRPFRGVSHRLGESCSASHAPASTSIEVPVQRFIRRFDRVVLVRPTPSDLCRFRPGPSGFLSPPSLPVLTPIATPLCRLPCSSKPYIQPSAAPASAMASAPLLGFLPLQRSKAWAPVYPGSSTFRHCPSSGFSTLSTSCFTHVSASFLSAHETVLRRLLCTLAHAPGVPSDLHRSPRPFDRNRAAAPKSPLQGFLLSRDEHVLACSPLSRFIGARRPLRDHTTTDATESRSQKNRCIPRELPKGTSPPEVPGQPSRS